VFSTPADLVNGEVVFAPIEDENSVDQLRDQIGILYLAKYKKTLMDFYILSPSPDKD
jgi:hypothetical protein